MHKVVVKSLKNMKKRPIFLRAVSKIHNIQTECSLAPKQMILQRNLRGIALLMLPEVAQSPRFSTFGRFFMIFNDLGQPHALLRCSCVSQVARNDYIILLDDN